MIWTGGIPGVLLVVGLLFIPESPRWLVWLSSVCWIWNIVKFCFFLVSLFLHIELNFVCWTQNLSQNIVRLKQSICMGRLKRTEKRSSKFVCNGSEEKNSTFLMKFKTFRYVFANNIHVCCFHIIVNFTKIIACAFSCVCRRPRKPQMLCPALSGAIWSSGNSFRHLL